LGLSRRLGPAAVCDCAVGGYTVTCESECCAFGRRACRRGAAVFCRSRCVLSRPHEMNCNLSCVHSKYVTLNVLLKYGRRARHRQTASIETAHHQEVKRLQIDIRSRFRMRLRTRVSATRFTPCAVNRIGEHTASDLVWTLNDCPPGSLARGAHGRTHGRTGTDAHAPRYGMEVSPQRCRAAQLQRLEFSDETQ
jgi:hypothetical protein